MDEFIIYENGIANWDLSADYRKLVVPSFAKAPDDVFKLNKDKTMSIMKYIKNSEMYEYLLSLSILLDVRMNGKVSAYISKNNQCTQCCKIGEVYVFDDNCDVYKAIGAGFLMRCVQCTDCTIHITNPHPGYNKLKFRQEQATKYQFTSHGNNLVAKSDSIYGQRYYVLTIDKYTILQQKIIPVKYYQEILYTADNSYDCEEMKCPICEVWSSAPWVHNRTCIKNINNFYMQIYSEVNWLIKILDFIPSDIKNLITSNIILTS